ncbi:hypothetical protein AGMMS49525_01000 [Bacteroidia bacterium]|nr:hypothetical protein AGMMS49525_01000 [Bacteroidia bacterium]
MIADEGSLNLTTWWQETTTKKLGTAFSTDTDTYSFTATAGYRYWFLLTEHLGNAYIELFDANGVLVFGSYIYDECYLLGDLDGTYFFRVTSKPVPVGGFLGIGFKDVYYNLSYMKVANTYTVSYDGNGATDGSTASSSHTYDAAKNLATNGFTKTGYTFAGWATSASGPVVYSNGQSVSNLTPTNNGTVTLYAKWTPNTYTINLVPQSGGSNGISTFYERYNTGWSLTENGAFNPTLQITPPTRIGSTFMGYYTGGDITPQRQIITAAGIVKNGEATLPSTILYAKWKPAPIVTTNLDDAFDQWTNKVTLSWIYDNPNASVTGNFYIYRRQVQEPEVEYTLLGNHAVTNGTYQTMTYTDTIAETEFSKVFEYFIGFHEGTPDNINDIDTANRVVVQVNTKPTLPFNVETEGHINSIDISFTPDRRLYGTDYTYRIQRRVNAITPDAPFVDWVSANQYFNHTNGNITFTDDSTNFTVKHNDPGLTLQCDIYEYKVIISAFDTTFERISVKTSPASTAFVKIAKPFTATMGEHTNYVRLQWTVDKLSASTTETYRVFRQLASDNPETGAWDELETVTSSAATVYWNDNNALTGVFYRYRVVLYQVCSGVEKYLAQKDDIGFTQAFGLVSGRITYGTGGDPVKDVNVLVKKTDLMDGEKQYHSLKSTGGGQKFEFLADSAYFNKIWTSKNWTLQYWLRPDGTNTGNATIGFIGGNEIYMSQVENGYRVYTNFGGSTSTSEIIPANKFSHIAITRSGNDMKIYTVVGANQDSISLKNTAFTCPAANIQSAANSKISFGYSLKGYVDDIRFWGKALTEAEIRRDYSRMLVGNENGLKGYWTLDEGLPGYAFDRSRVGTTYNRNHATTVTLTGSDIVPDDTYQLALKGITDTNGNYQINGIAYSGEGTSYSIIPSFGSEYFPEGGGDKIDSRHKFNPTEQLRYISASSMVHNATDFTDISSFVLRGKVVYEGGNYPVEGCTFEIDGSPVIVNNQQEKSSVNGEFAISVPIGVHKVQVKKNGHTFANDGLLQQAGADINYKSPRADIIFKDQTRVKLIGHIVGGKREHEKTSGFGKRVNNIGSDVLKLTAAKTNYQFLAEDTLFLHNTGDQWAKWSNQTGTSNDTTRMSIAGNNITIHVSPRTGEYVAWLYPEVYTVNNIEAGNYGHIYTENATLDLRDAPVMDERLLKSNVLTYADSVWVDRKGNQLAHYEYGEKSDTVRFHHEWGYYYQAQPSYGVQQLKNSKPVDYFGNETFKIDEETTLPLVTGSTYLFGKPVFTQNEPYAFQLSAFENYHNPATALTDTVPVTGALVSFTGELLAENPDPIELDSLGQGVFEFYGGAVNLTTGVAALSTKMIVDGQSYYSTTFDEAGLSAYVLGGKGTGTDFVTSAGDKIDFVLHDPPGSESYAYIEKGTVTSSTETLNTSDGFVSDNTLSTIWGEKLSVTAGFLGNGVSVEALDAKNALGGGVNVSRKRLGGHTYMKREEFNERFQTSASPDFVGHEGDIFVGTGTNMLYGINNNITVSKAAGLNPEDTILTVGDYAVAKQKSFNIGVTFGTQFIYTAYEIENIMIPKWKNMAKEIFVFSDEGIDPNSIPNPVYVSKLPENHPNFGKNNDDRNAFGSQATDAFDGPSYKLILPTALAAILGNFNPTIPIGTIFFTDSIRYYNGKIGMWEKHLAGNEERKVKADFDHAKNISFGAGTQYEESKVHSNDSITIKDGLQSTADLYILADIGFTIKSCGFNFTTKTGDTRDETKLNSEEKEHHNTTGFVLAENGTTDEISVDYLLDNDNTNNLPTYMFRTRGGRTSCPYEGATVAKYYQPEKQHILSAATMQIEVPKILVKDGAYRVQVPSTRAAAYTLELTNESETDGTGNFKLFVDESTNPDGAVLKIDGLPIGNGRYFTVRSGQVLRKTLTIEKGPTVDAYNDIRLILASDCDGNLSDDIFVSAEYLPSCSDVSIKYPANNWIINTETGDKISVELENYDVNFSNFGYVELQYRSVTASQWSSAMKFYANQTRYDNAQGDKTLLTSSDQSIEYDWHKGQRPDGEYEFRAHTVCETAGGVKVAEYYTPAVRGTVDMTKPVSLGAPSPANGIYGAGDELSITFNENINTAMVTSNNIAVTHGASKTVVPVDFVTSANKITFEYPADYRWISDLEGETLDITVSGIYDMHGNQSDTIRWQAYVNRNALVWESDEINLVKEAGKTLQFTAKIKNTGSNTISYKFDDANLNMHLPQWLSVNQPTGTLQPLQSKELTFTISAGVNLGSYSEQIGVTSGNLIAKNLPINLTVTGALPEGWTVNPANYESTMTVTGRVRITGTFQNDPADILAAFIGDECVGITAPIKPQASSNEYFTFLTIYGNAANAGQAVKFKFWDASTGNIYSVIESTLSGAVQTITFSANAMKGTVLVPIIHNVQNLVEQSVAFNNGWSWISVNVLNSNPGILSQFVNRIGANGIQLKSKNGYVEAPDWIGTLSSIEKEQMYLVQTDAATTLKFDGTPATPASSPITLANGWNWLGYLPQFTLPVNEALNNLAAQANDQIKGQTAYRSFASSAIGWVGTLNYLRAGEGYMYYSGAGASKNFTYPGASSQIYSLRSAAASEAPETTPDNHWTVDIHAYPNSMTMTSVITINGEELQSDQIEIAAFDANGQCRGSMRLNNYQQVAEHPYLAFLMIYGEESVALTFKAYDHTTGREYAVTNTENFTINNRFGNSRAPYEFVIAASIGIDEIGIEQIWVYPNPVKDELFIKSDLPIKKVEIYTLTGTLLMQESNFNEKISVASLPAGVYMITVHTESGTSINKFVKK